MLAFAACNGGGSGLSPTATAEPAATIEPTALQAAPLAMACAPGRPHAPGDFDGTVSSGGLERTYILHVPASYDGSAPSPLVLNFHAFTSNATQQAAYSTLPAKADEAGFIVVMPQGTGSPTFWSLLRTSEPDDVGFTAGLLDALEAELCIDSARIFSTGLSNGAAFSYLLACELPDRIAAIGPVAAHFFPSGCTGRPVPIRAFHGTEDPIVPFAGGDLAPGLKRSGTVPPVQETVAAWAEHNGCAAAPVESQVTASIRLQQYEGCEAPVELYIVDGGGHTWPDAAEIAALGATTHEINAADLIWEFFTAYPAEPEQLRWDRVDDWTVTRR